MPLKVIFAGTSDFGLPSLKLLHEKHNVIAVYSKPDKPSGRGQKITYNPIKNLANKYNLPIYQPESLNNNEEVEKIKRLNADVMVSVAYGLFLPATILHLSKFGCLNVHPSLLPKYRGASPIQYAILNGDKETGVTIMYVDEGWDTGDILSQRKIEITSCDTTKTLTDKLSQDGGALLIEVIKKLENNSLVSSKQNDKLSCYAGKISKQQAAINWEASAVEIDRIVRAFNPWPIAFSVLDEFNIRILQSMPIESEISQPSGEIIKIDKKYIDVATGKGTLRLLKVQFSGGKVLSMQDVLNSKKDMFKVGKRFNG